MTAAALLAELELAGPVVAASTAPGLLEGARAYDGQLLDQQASGGSPPLIASRCAVAGDRGQERAHRAGHRGARGMTYDGTGAPQNDRILPYLRYPRRGAVRR